MTTQEKIEVMKAYTEGKKIQVRDRVSGVWIDWGTSGEPDWYWGMNEYRIKPESTYRPYKNTEEMIEDYKRRFGVRVPTYAMPMIWVKNKQSDDVYAITGYFGSYVKVSDEVITLAALFTRYTYLDGSPCGMKEE